MFDLLMIFTRISLSISFLPILLFQIYYEIASFFTVFKSGIFLIKDMLKKLAFSSMISKNNIKTPGTSTFALPTLKFGKNRSHR